MQTYYIICIRCTAGNFFCSNNECHAFFTQAARENTGLYFEKRAHTMYSDLQMATGRFRDSSSAQNRIKKALQTPHFEVFTTLSQLWQRARDSNPRGFRLTRVPGGLLSHSVNPLCYFVQIRTTFTIITQSMNFASEIYRKFYFILFIGPIYSAFRLFLRDVSHQSAENIFRILFSIKNLSGQTAALSPFTP